VFRNVAGVAFGAGSDTSVSAMCIFFMAMAAYPEVQKKAYEEINRVVGKGRLPAFDDRDSLPYVNAIIKESMRWEVVAPLTTPHLSTEDDIYDGYFVPKGTLVMGNAWSILHDPSIYPDPFEFKPERFLKNGIIDNDVLDPIAVAFGFGRRICPGRHFADNAMYSAIVSVLATFEIKAPLDETGKPMKMECDMTSGLISFPKPFKCLIHPRSATCVELIHGSEEVP